ncbi:hypothetical protein ARALYDRAFT_910999 [Arabidopsis lyrata subsp. lyrata]|uniref:Uncharacterized protein n=1 Tax=Arabidopsis lyrata subsp. lyrata TaxID=81972 RepID=D7M7J9_ARALL|nr:hypothetical protein ARALYDRAFT_910999 [Arabidopsis lyrata subsp. lyrata]
MAPRVRGGKSKGRGRGRGPQSPAKRPVVPTRPISSGVSTRRPRSLLPQYEFTPVNPQDPIPEAEQPEIRQPSPRVSLRDYPPPQQLFQSGEGSLHASGGSPRGSGSTPFRASRSTQVRGSVSSIHRLASGSHRAAQSPAPVQSPPLNQPRARASVSGHSSQAQNVEDGEDEEDEEGEEGESEEEGLRESTLPEDVLATLNDLLSVPGRDLYTTVISPTLEPGTTW